MKCFGIEVNRLYTKDILSYYLTFNDTLNTIINQSGIVFIKFNYPHQTLRSKSFHTMWSTFEKDKRMEMLIISSIEILKRRKKQQEHCLDNWMFFDDVVLQKSIENVGCTAPYQNSSKQFPMCDTQQRMEMSVFDGWRLAVDYLYVPCQEIASLSYTNTKQNISRRFGNSFAVSVTFPDQIKVITQSQAVDIHSLIGNIGGYIGLFLGTH